MKRLSECDGVQEEWKEGFAVRYEGSVRCEGEKREECVVRKGEEMSVK